MLVLNMAILIYIENQGVFFHRGVRAQLGYMAQWIEFNKEKKSDLPSIKNNSTMQDATLKRNLNGLQDGGIYFNATGVYKESKQG